MIKWIINNFIVHWVGLSVRGCVMVVRLMVYLFVVPSIYKKTQLEGGPLTLIEAMASKTLCLVSDSIGFITHCNENNSIIFRSGDIEDLELKLNQFTEMDREKLNKIKDEGFKTANYFKFLNIGKLHSEFLFR